MIKLTKCIQIPLRVKKRATSSICRPALIPNIPYKKNKRLIPLTIHEYCVHISQPHLSHHGPGLAAIRAVESTHKNADPWPFKRTDRQEGNGCVKQSRLHIYTYYIFMKYFVRCRQVMKWILLLLPVVNRIIRAYGWEKYHHNVAGGIPASEWTVTKAPNNHQGILRPYRQMIPTWRKWRDENKKRKKKNKSAADVLYFALGVEIKSGCDPIRDVLLLQFDVSMETFLPKQRGKKGAARKGEHFSWCDLIDWKR